MSAKKIEYILILLSTVALILVSCGASSSPTQEEEAKPQNIPVSVSTNQPSTKPVEVTVTLTYHCLTISEQDYVTCTSTANEVSIFAAGVEVSVSKNGVYSGESFRWESTDTINVTVCGKPFSLPSMATESEKQKVEISTVQC